MTIGSSNIVFCVAEAGTGKTFTGDYLDLFHGFAHVDGDLAYRSNDDLKMRDSCKEFATRIIEGRKLYPQLKDPNSSDDLAGLEEYWDPVYQMLVDSALEAAKTNDNVVITHYAPYQDDRDFVMNKLKEGGAQNVTMLFLSMDKKKKLEGLYHRSKRQAEASGSTLGDWLRLQEWEGKGEPTMEEYIEHSGKPGKIGDMATDGPPSYAKIVDVTGRDVTAINGVDSALGLLRSCKESYEEIVKKVVARDHKRDEETPYRWDLLTEIYKDTKKALANAATDEEKKQIKRRSSLLTALELKTGRLSILLDDSSADHLKNKRRSSLIITGKIDIDINE
mmetsp:Transcript_49737/g.56275  ORF Transcript_49737/g.56275 Transcript_49737/m.56275 type:complete len:335 (-) Transcript_49737:192-1196(-)